MAEKNSKFKFGVDIFRKINLGVPRVFQKNLKFAGGKSFPLLRGEVKSIPADEVSSYMYVTEESDV